jgi:AraC-like DNA-binding protein
VIAAEAEALLLRRLDRRLDLAELAAELELSPWHLSRAFRAATGATLSARHERLRLAAACERLLDGERDLAGLAHALGFCDHAHLTRRFRAVLGLAPSALRNPIQARPPARR